MIWPMGGWDRLGRQLGRFKGKDNLPALDRGKEAISRAKSVTLSGRIAAKDGDAGDKAELVRQAVRDEQTMA